MEAESPKPTKKPAATADVTKPGLREWTDASGKYRIQASLERVTGGRAILVKADGSKSSVPLARLSQKDQKYIRDELKRRRAEPKVSDK